MNIKEKVNQLLFSVGLKAEEIKLAQMTLADGVTILEADAFEAGKDVFIVSENGNVKLPIGEYDLPDGQVLIVEEEGVIAEIKEAVAEEEMPESAHPQAEATEPPMAMEQETVKPKKTVEIKEVHFAEMEELKKEIEALKAENIKLKESEPAVKPIVHNPEAKQTTNEMTGNLSFSDRFLNAIYK